MNMKNLKYGYSSGSASKPVDVAKRFVILAILFAFYCCSPKLAPPVAADADCGKTIWNECTLEKLTEAHQLYIKKCGSCHSVKIPRSLSEEKWRTTLPKMAKKAKLNEEQQALLLNYILTMRESELQPKK